MEGFTLFLLPLVLGLLGFIEPCSIGSTLLVVKFLEGKSAVRKLMETLTFVVVRALFTGVLGAGAALVGQAFTGVQKGVWVLLGGLYLLLGVLVLAGRAGTVARLLSLRFRGFEGRAGAVSLGLLFGLNIPACAAPLLFALFGLAAQQGATGGTILSGFLMLALFGFALSFPLLLAVLSERARKALDQLASLSARSPAVAGMVLLALGLWSIAMGFLVDLEKWT